MPDDKLVLENAKLIFRNFGGTPSQYNPEGKRSFNVILDPKLAKRLKAEGWNIRTSEGRDEDGEPQYHVNVAVSFDHVPPTIMLVTKKRQTPLNAETVGMLDFAEIATADLTIRPYHWDVPPNKGIKAYLASLYVVIEEDALAEKYADIPAGDKEPTPVPSGEKQPELEY